MSRAGGRRSSASGAATTSSVNRNKRSVALDLKAPEGADALAALVATPTSSSRTSGRAAWRSSGSAMRRWRAINPRLIYCSISGYGQNGPRAPLPGYDVVLQGEAGFMDVTGSPDGEPTRAGVAITDYLAGLYAVQGILLALHDRHRSGLGQHVDIALFDSMLSVMRLPLGMLLATGAAPLRVGNEHPSIAPYEPLNTPRTGRSSSPSATRGCGDSSATAIERDRTSRAIRGSRPTRDRLANRAALKAAIEAAFERFTVHGADRSARGAQGAVRPRAHDRRCHRRHRRWRRAT